MPVLITGGARSGKSRFAERYAACLGARGYYVATSRIWDEEMRERVALHKADRESSAFPWETVEEPLELAGRLQQLERLAAGAGASIMEADDTGTAGSMGAKGYTDFVQVPDAAGTPLVILVDCMTLWLTNVLMASSEDGDWSSESRDRAARAAEAELDRLLPVLRSFSAPLILVSNEVGDGIVPEYPLGRLFRDLAGRMNQRLAAECDQVFLVTAGIPVELKRLAFQLPPLFGASGGLGQKG